VGPRGEERPAVLTSDDAALDVSRHVADFDSDFFAAGGLVLLSEVLEEDLPLLDLGGLRLGSPIARPHKIIGIGLNYEDHAREAGMEIPAEPVLFMKATNSLSGPYDDILLPPGSAKVDWEVELGVVMGQGARYLSDDAEAEKAIAGFCVAHDVSERSWQLERGGQWVKGKSAETFCPLGPWLVTPEEISDVMNLDLALSVNGSLRQSGNTSNLIFSPRHLVWYLSQMMVLEPGDVIITGTPPGVGLASGTFLGEGDVVELSITGLGAQRAVCRGA
jgi:2-keto-4-pentenoate hydratase/2-oxohepta-3-ene-1,7-dioic acid hydratase in catechol pathway